MKAALLVFLFILALPAQAKESPYSFTLQLPLFDSAGKRVAEFSPSLGQAQALTQDYYLGVHWALAKAFDTSNATLGSPIENLAILAFDYLSTYSPLGLSWLHEEAHRSVLNQFGIRSHNGIYDASLGASVIPVDHVRDADLIELKREHPADFVRLSTAGMEAESQFALHLEKAQFFEHALPRQRFLLLLSHLGPISYRMYCNSMSADQTTEEDLAHEGPDESKRDFTGFDCVSYVYDLFRPFEPYEDRGPHPSGEGIARYRNRYDLTASEREYLHHMAVLSWLNMIDPFLLGFPGWDWGDYRWTANLRHHLAPFGQSLEENVFVKSDTQQHLFILRQYSNQHATQPGLEWQCLACQTWNGGGSLDLRAAVWSQPKDLLFGSRHWFAGGYVALQMKQGLNDSSSVFAEVLSKTQGWMADEIDLGASTLLRLGLTWTWKE